MAMIPAFIVGWFVGTRTRAEAYRLKRRYVKTLLKLGCWYWFIACFFNFAARFRLLLVFRQFK
jgi:hypothetical protein